MNRGLVGAGIVGLFTGAVIFLGYGIEAKNQEKDKKDQARKEVECNKYKEQIGPTLEQIQKANLNFGSAQQTDIRVELQGGAVCYYNIPSAAPEPAGNV